jgi:hypothetical protein
VETADRLTSGYAMRDGVEPYTTSLLEYATFRERGHSFATSGIGMQRFFNLLEHGEPQVVRGAAVNAEYFTTLGVKAVHGRLFLPKWNNIRTVFGGASYFKAA